MPMEVKDTAGNVLLFNDSDENVVVNAAVTNFEPVPGMMFCRCGKEFKRWNSNPQNNGTSMIVCPACHATQGFIAVAVEVID